MLDSVKTKEQLIAELELARRRITGFEATEAKRKRVEQALEKRIVALMRPLDDAEGIRFEEMFNVDDIQRLQDEFALAVGVASIITYPDGTPITKPSNFCRLCKDIIRKTEKGLANCFKSDAAIGRLSALGPTVRQCMSGGLWDAGAGISVGGRHIANWLIGQVRDATQSQEHIRGYAREIGADEDEMVQAFQEVPSMSRERFGQVAKALFTVANQLSVTAYQNVQQARFIADRKRAEEELVRQKTLLHSVIEGATDAIFVKDLQGCYILVNSEVASVIGKPVGEILGRDDTVLFPPAEAAVIMANDRLVMDTGISQNAQEVLTTTRGVLTYLCIKAPLRDQEDTIIGMFGISRDITELIKARELLVHTEKMMSVGGLAAGMAHEINNPLSGILQNVQVVRRRLTDDTPMNIEAARNAGCSLQAIAQYMETRGIHAGLENIRKSGERAAQVVRSMLEFSRSSEPTRASVNLSELLEESVKLCATDYDLIKKYDFKKITLEKEFASDIPDVPCSRTQIQQVMMNLLGNSAQAMRGVASPKIWLRTRRKDDLVCFEVEDNGPGIDGALRRKIFEPFFTTKPVGEGTGLGLAMSYFIITNNHRGTIEVESAPGKGARFIISLPVRAEERDTPSGS